LIGVLLINAAIAYRRAREMHDDSYSLEHTYEVLANLRRIQATIEDAESDVRGFLITGEPRYQLTYDRARTDINEQIARYAELTTDNPAQGRQIPKLRELVAKEMSELGQAVDMRNRQPSEAALKARATDEDKTMDAIRGLISRMQDQERALRQERQAANDRAYESAAASSIVSLMLGLTAVGAFLWLLQMHLSQRRRTEAQMARLLADEQVRSKLLARVAEASLTINSASGQESVLGVIQAEAAGIIGARHAEVLQSAADRTAPPGGIVAPLLGRNGQPFAHLLVRDKVNGDFDANDRAVLAQVAQMGAIAFDNARLYEELRAADRHKDEFLATLAHELRNPLAPIRSALQVMQLAGDDPRALQTSQTIIDRQIQQMVHLIEDLLDVSRISRGKMELRRKRVALSEVVNSAVETSRPFIDAAQHRLTVTLPDEPIPLNADLTRLAQVFLNLLNNSAKYTEAGGDIRLSAERQGSTVIVRVRDNGMGISSSMLPHVFEMFTQADRSLERTQGGLGIGLTLVKRIVELHGGSVEARSDGAGKGSEFAVRLPVAAESRLRPVDAEPGRSPTVCSAARHRILVVDDNRDAADTLATLLRMKGHEVQTAYDGIEAVDAAANYRPAAVLLDVGLPRLNGFDAARRIRQLPNDQDIVLIALTGWGQEEDRRRSRDAGFDDHLVKPVDPNHLERVLMALVQKAVSSSS
jgi:signal transduction histidine kinase/ActR/RegA family two-component response regulator